ncbi:hypothetical protein [Tsukamurella soli]|uniref:Transposase n=1 Tax=Tsukamurella soli TaxID=644556 RepID=A0ABP8JB13_9ACTN
MSISPGWTVETIREFVYGYQRMPHGTKVAFMRERGVTRRQLTRWCDAVFDGDLDAGLIPREGGQVTKAPQRRVAARAQASRDAEVDQLRKLEATNEALGKAIGLLHKLNAADSVYSVTVDRGQNWLITQVGDPTSGFALRGDGPAPGAAAPSGTR